MAKKETVLETPAQETSVQAPAKASAETVDLSKYGFIHIKTPLPEKENIFDFLARKAAAANGEDFEYLKGRLMVSLQVAIDNSRKGGWRTGSWELAYEAFYLGVLRAYSENGKMHPVEKFATFKSGADHTRLPYCGGCQNTPRVAVLGLLKALTESKYWEAAKEGEKPLFGSLEAYRGFIRKI